MKLPIIVLLSAFILAGCLPGVTGSKTKFDPGTFVQGGIVSDFPNMPLYPGVEVIESYGDSVHFGASFVTSDKLDKVVNFYNTSLIQLGWDTVFVQNSDTNYSFNIKNALHEGEIIINTASDLKRTAITVSVQLR